MGETRGGPRRRLRLLAAPLVVIAVGGGLTACGSSSTVQGRPPTTSVIVPGRSYRIHRARRVSVDIPTLGSRALAMTTPVSEAVCVEWARRVAAEYAVCVMAQDVAQRLTLIAAPPDLIEGALRMALDAAGTRTPRTSAVRRDRVDGSCRVRKAYVFDTSPEPAVHVAAIAVPNLCLGETLALRIVHRLRRNAEAPAARAALDRVVADEPRHVALGWETLDWLLELPAGESVRRAVERDLPGWVATLRDSFAGPCPQPHLAGLTPEDIAWGLASPDVQREIFEEVVEQDWKPRLGRRGFCLA